MSKTQAASTGKMAIWSATLRDREAAAAVALEQRRVRALEVAHEAASILKERFGAERVVLFGSLAHRLWFSPASDVDLAVAGLDAHAHLDAIARLEEIEPALRVDLLRIERCPAALRAKIEDEGIDL